MPRVKLSAELKSAIEKISDKEKNKLIFRLLPSKEVLVETLEFQLLEKGETTSDRREDLRNEITRVLSRYPEMYRTPWGLVQSMRTLSAKITRHVAVTKDKLGEIDLHFYLVNTVLKLNYDNISTEGSYTMEKLSKYVIQRSKRINTMLTKIHEDYIVEFEEDMVELANYINEIKTLSNEAAYLDFNVSYFVKGEVILK